MNHLSLKKSTIFGFSSIFSIGHSIGSRERTDELVDVQIDAVWSTSLEQFDFDTDMSTTALSRAIAREPWSREYFDTLKE